MLAVNIGAAEMKQMIASDVAYVGLEISCDNSHTDCVVGGPNAQLQALKASLDTRKIRSKTLDVPMAYHTISMDPILEELTNVAKTIKISPPKLPVVSNVFGRMVQPGEKAFTSEYFALHCRQTVAFTAGMTTLCEGEKRGEISRWIEIGPHPSLLQMISSMVKKSTTDLLPSLKKGTTASEAIAKLLAHFYQKATGIDWRKAFEKESTLVTIPALPFSQHEFGVAYQHEEARRTSDAPEQSSDFRSLHPFLATFVQRPSQANSEAIFETPISVLKEYILGHLVCEHALCPASVYHEIALAAFSLAFKEHDGNKTIRTLANVVYSAPLLYSENSKDIIRVTIKPGSGDHSSYSFTVASYQTGSDPRLQTTHCQGRLKIRSQAHAQKYEKAVPLVERQKARFSRMDQFSTQVFLRKAMYEKVFTRVVIYSGLYQMVQSIRIDQDEAIAVCRFPNAKGDIPGARTILMDVLLHVAGFVANLNIDNDDVCICKEVKSATLARDFPFTDAEFHVYCSNIEVATNNMVMADAYAVDSQGVIAVFKGMAFQRIKLTRMAQALRLTAAKSSPAPPSAPLMPKTAKLMSISSTSSTPSEPSIPSSSEIREIIAKTCNLEVVEITARTELQSLGFDSLMIIELVSGLSSQLRISIDMSALQECETVDDVERLCGDANSSGPSRSSSEAETGIYFTMPTTPATPATPAVPSDRTAIAALIAETCGASIASVNPDIELEALGIDSLMMIELEARLRFPNLKRPSFSELSKCRTVRDIEELVGS